MAASVLDMSASLDGFVAGPNERPDNLMGDGGHRLHAWFLTGGGAPGAPAFDPGDGVDGRVFGELRRE